MIEFNIRFFSWFKIQENGNSCCAVIRYSYHFQLCGYSCLSLFGYFFLVSLYKLLDSKLCLTIIIRTKWEFPWYCTWIFLLITSLADVFGLIMQFGNFKSLTQVLQGHHLAEPHQAQICSLQFIFRGTWKQISWGKASYWFSISIGWVYGNGRWDLWIHQPLENSQDNS